MTKERLLNDPYTFGVNLYGLSAADVPQSTLKRTTVGKKYKYSLTVKGNGFKTQTFSYTIPKYTSTVKISGGKKLTIKYAIPKGDFLQVKISKGGITKTVNLKKTKETKKIKLPQGKYKVKVKNFLKGTNYSGTLNVTKKVKIK